MTFLNNLLWREATKKFDINKKINIEDYQKIKDSIRFAPTAKGLQPFKVLDIKNKELLKMIKTDEINKERFLTADKVLLFCGIDNLHKLVKKMFDKKSNYDDNLRIKFEKAENSIIEILNTFDNNEKIAWVSSNTHVALGFALAACSELNIDSCPISIFEKESVKNTFNLDENLNPFVFLTLGYRDSDENHNIKWRFEEKDLFSEIN